MRCVFSWMEERSTEEIKTSTAPSLASSSTQTEINLPTKEREKHQHTNRHTDTETNICRLQYTHIHMHTHACNTHAHTIHKHTCVYLQGISRKRLNQNLVKLCDIEPIIISNNIYWHPLRANMNFRRCTVQVQIAIPYSCSEIS